VIFTKKQSSPNDQTDFGCGNAALEGYSLHKLLSYSVQPFGLAKQIWDVVEKLTVTQVTFLFDQASICQTKKSRGSFLFSKE